MLGSVKASVAPVVGELSVGICEGECSSVVGELSVGIREGECIAQG